jgi:aryl-alcohol dehydrogenase-like predicted oxidoreductase
LSARVCAPIASATTVAQLEDLIAGAHLVLDAQSIARLDEASRPPQDMKAA